MSMTHIVILALLHFLGICTIGSTYPWCGKCTPTYTHFKSKILPIHAVEHDHVVEHNHAVEHDHAVEQDHAAANSLQISRHSTQDVTIDFMCVLPTLITVYQICSTFTQQYPAQPHLYNGFSWRSWTSARSRDTKWSGPTLPVADSSRV